MQRKLINNRNKGGIKEAHLNIGQCVLSKRGNYKTKYVVHFHTYTNLNAPPLSLHTVHDPFTVLTLPNTDATSGIAHYGLDVLQADKEVPYGQQ